MKRLFLIITFLFSFISVNSICFGDTQRGLRNYQDIISGRKSLEQLNKTELNEVLDIHTKLGKSKNRNTSQPSYEIEHSHNDELFIINGEKFEAKTYCFNMDEGDRVIFIEGSALGACASATIVNLRTNNKCEVWCE